MIDDDGGELSQRRDRRLGGRSVRLAFHAQMLAGVFKGVLERR